MNGLGKAKLTNHQAFNKWLLDGICAENWCRWPMVDYIVTSHRFQWMSFLQREYQRILKDGVFYINSILVYALMWCLDLKVWWRNHSKHTPSQLIKEYLHQMVHIVAITLFIACSMILFFSLRRLSLLHFYVNCITYLQYHCRIPWLPFNHYANVD